MRVELRRRNTDTSVRRSLREREAGDHGISRARTDLNRIPLNVHVDEFGQFGRVSDHRIRIERKRDPERLRIQGLPGRVGKEGLVASWVTIVVGTVHAVAVEVQ